jgi:hypothetical protein
MSIDTETFVRYARAEKDLCQKASAVLTQIIKEIEDTHGVKIAEVRVTMDPSDSANGWSAANCVMVRGEHQDFASDRARRTWNTRRVHVRERSTASFSRQ